MYTDADEIVLVLLTVNNEYTAVQGCMTHYNPLNDPYLLLSLPV